MNRQERKITILIIRKLGKDENTVCQTLLMKP